MPEKPNILGYIDYILYLTDWYTYQKSLKPSFSYRLFSQKAQFKSKSHLASVLSGTKHLSRKSIPNISEAVKLSKADAEYFSHLVYFKTSKTISEKNIYWSKIKEFQIPNLNKRKVFRQYELFKNWYTLPIREIICTATFSNYKQLGKMVIPAISQKEAHESVTLLLELGLVEKKGTLYSQTSFDILVDPDLKRLATHNFQKQVIQLGAEALSTLPDSERNTQTITFGSNGDLNDEINRIINRCIEDIYTAAQKHTKITEVKQFNLQLFSMSKPYLTAQ